MQFSKSVLYCCVFCWIAWWVLIITSSTVALISAMLSCLSSCYATIKVIPVIPAQSPVPHSSRSSVALRPMYLLPHQNVICCILFVLPNLCKYADSSLASPFFFSPDLQLIKRRTHTCRGAVSETCWAWFFKYGLLVFNKNIWLCVKEEQISVFMYGIETLNSV